mgnify:CR=1 FL=1
MCDRRCDGEGEKNSSGTTFEGVTSRPSRVNSTIWQSQVAVSWKLVMLP